MPTSPPPAPKNPFAEELYGSSYLITKGFKIMRSRGAPITTRIYVLGKTLVLISSLNSVKLITSLINIVSLIFAIITPYSQDVFAVSIVSLLVNFCVLLLTMHRVIDDGTTRRTKYKNKAYVSQYLTMNHIINIVSASLLLVGTVQFEMVLAIFRLLYHCGVFILEIFTQPQLFCLNAIFVYILLRAAFACVCSSTFIVLYIFLLVWFDIVLSVLTFVFAVIADILLCLMCQSRHHIDDYKAFPIWGCFDQTASETEGENRIAIDNFAKVREDISERLRKDKADYVEYLNKIQPDTAAASPPATSPAHEVEMNKETTSHV